MSGNRVKSQELRVKNDTALGGRSFRGEKVWVVLVACVLVVVPFHAFLTVWASTVLGHYTLLRLWPECGMLLLSMWFFASRQFARVWQDLNKFHLGWPILLYLVLAILYFGAAVVHAKVGLQAAGYGLLLATRPVVWFVLVYAVASRSVWLKQHWQSLILIPLMLVVLFALLQFFVLPADFLKHFGYIKDVTIAPAQTINQDTSTRRAQSFLRGPNPLGAYLVLGIGLAYLVFRTYKAASLLILAALGALFVSFSRSAWLGLIVAVVAGVGTRYGFTVARKQVFAALFAFLALLLVLAGLLQHNEGAKNALLHVNDQSTAAQTSNEDRLSALKTGLREVAHEPLGRGLGTAGPASVYAKNGVVRNSENYFLGIGQELGWFGLGLFVLICYRLAMLLYSRKEAFPHMLFAVFAGLILVNMLSYAWADVTITYLWWGLAAIALASPKLDPARSRTHEPKNA